MANIFVPWEGPGTYALNVPALAPMAEYEVFVYCDFLHQLEDAIREYKHAYNITPMVQRVEVERGRCYC